jgi:hypothetical protein
MDCIRLDSRTLDIVKGSLVRDSLAHWPSRPQIHLVSLLPAINMADLFKWDELSPIYVIHCLETVFRVRRDSRKVFKIVLHK